MCTFKFIYVDGKELECKHIKSAVCTSGSEVPEKELLSHPFSVACDFQLFAENKTFHIVSGNLRCIEVTAE